MHKPKFKFPSSCRQSRPLRALSLVLLLLILCVPVAIHAQTGTGAADGDRLAQFQQSLDSLRRQYGIPGLSAAIVSQGEIIWEAGFGFQDVENQIRPRRTRVFRLFATEP